MGLSGMHCGCGCMEGWYLSRPADTKQSSPQETAGGGQGAAKNEEGMWQGRVAARDHLPAVTAAECACTATPPSAFSVTAYLGVKPLRSIVWADSRAAHLSATIHA